MGRYWCSGATAGIISGKYYCCPGSKSSCSSLDSFGMACSITTHLHSFLCGSCLATKNAWRKRKTPARCESPRWGLEIDAVTILITELVDAPGHIGPKLGFISCIQAPNDQ